MPAYAPGAAGTRNPSVNDPRIGTELRRFREKCGLPGDTVAHALRWSTSKVSRYERSRTSVTRRGLEQILKYYQQRYQMPLGQAEALLAMFDQAMGMSRFLHPFLGPAVLAAVVREWSSRSVPRLLQTHDYAMAVLNDLQPATAMSPGEIRDAAAGIAKWQTRLRETPPVRVQALLDESVLYRKAGSPEIMRAQLAHLDRLAGDGQAAIEIRVLPFAAGKAPRWVSAFSHLEYAPVPGSDASAEIVTEEVDGPGQPELSERGTWRRLQLFTVLWEAGDAPGTYVKRALSEAWG
jgi:transcriptional regulator with XRE-family HTH domain